MKTQISQYSFRKAKRYNGVYQQQGRMITDADWNESVDILKQLVHEAIMDVVGSGAPREGGIGLEDTGPGDPGAEIRIVPGDLYVDGIRAEISGDPATPIGFNAQADLPAYPVLDKSDDIIVYADVWERAVISLEDALLLDPGLHGADTCSRTRIMGQIKAMPWSQTREDAFDDGVVIIENPVKGNADFDLRLREGALAGDPCDPCEREVAYEAETGNYLFRLEVHQVEGPAHAPNAVILKWSSENGAEHYKLYRELEDSSLIEDLPPAFKHGQWIYDFFTPQTESHLGVHHHTGFTPDVRDLVSGGFAIPTDVAALPDEDKKREMVRRWDGWCRLDFPGGSASFTEGRDRGNDLNGEISRADITGGLLTLQLDTLILELQVDAVSFVAGDHWYAVARENAEENEKVRVLDASPLGIHHHYLKLGVVRGRELLPLDDPNQRRLSFPPLTNLTADRVGYDAESDTAVQQRWDDINETTGDYPETVQEAIDELVTNLESSDVAFQLPECGDVAKTVKDFLLEVVEDLDLDGDGKISVKDIIEALLCILDAGVIPYSAADNTASIKDLMLKKTGDSMTGPLIIDDGSGDSNQILLDVRGTAVMQGFKLTTGDLTNGYVLTYDDATSSGLWKESALRGWKIDGTDMHANIDGNYLDVNVGIGTDNIHNRLQIGNGDVAIGDLLHRAGKLRLWQEANNADDMVSHAIGTETWHNTYGAGALYPHSIGHKFYRGGNELIAQIGYGGSGTGTNRLNSYFRGNMGIGTVPRSGIRLYVNGDIYASGFIYGHDQILANISRSDSLAKNTASWATLPGMSVLVYLPANMRINFAVNIPSLYLDKTLGGLLGALYSVYVDLRLRLSYPDDDEAPVNYVNVFTANRGPQGTSTYNVVNDFTRNRASGTNQIELQWRYRQTPPGSNAGRIRVAQRTLQVSV